MDAVLHIEPISRSIPAPISVGHNDFIFYGEQLNEDDENVGAPTSSVRMGYPLRPKHNANHCYEFSVGCPLATIDTGGARTTLPLVKTLEYAPDLSRKSGHTFIETLHYHRADKTLIPYRSKIRSGLGRGLRINHLPSLNLIREDITGSVGDICDPREHIVAELLLRDPRFQRQENHPLRDWIMYDLMPNLQNPSVNSLSFGTGDMVRLIDQYTRTADNISTELTLSNTLNIRSIIQAEHDLVPFVYNSKKPIIRPIRAFRDAAVSHFHDFGSWGNIRPEQLPKMDYNPLAFQDLCELIDHIPLTDFNVDMVVTPGDEIAYYCEHIAVDRFAVFDDNDIGQYTGKTIIEMNFDGYMLNEIINKFINFHSGVTDEIEDLLVYRPVKVKIIKTITDEAAVLLYPGDSGPNDPPLCGVYFDIAVQSLAPMSIIPEPVLN